MRLVLEWLFLFSLWVSLPVRTQFPQPPKAPVWWWCFSWRTPEQPTDKICGFVGLAVWFGQRIGEKRERIWIVGLTTSGPRANQYDQQVFSPSFSVIPPWLGFHQWVFVALPLGQFHPLFQMNHQGNPKKQNHYPQFYEQDQPLFPG